MKRIVRPCNDFVAVKIKSGEQQINGIIIPDSNDEKGIIGTVVSLGRGIYNFNSDKVVEHEVKIGDTVVLPKMGTQKIEVDGEEYVFCQAHQVVAVIEEVQ